MGYNEDPTEPSSSPTPTPPPPPTPVQQKSGSLNTDAPIYYPFLSSLFAGAVTGYVAELVIHPLEALPNYMKKLTPPSQSPTATTTATTSTYYRGPRFHYDAVKGTLRLFGTRQIDVRGMIKETTHAAAKSAPVTSLFFAFYEAWKGVIVRVQRERYEEKIHKFQQEFASSDKVNDMVKPPNTGLACAMAGGLGVVSENVIIHPARSIMEQVQQQRNIERRTPTGSIVTPSASSGIGVAPSVADAASSTGSSPSARLKLHQIPWSKLDYSPKTLMKGSLESFLSMFPFLTLYLYFSDRFAKRYAERHDRPVDQLTLAEMSILGALGGGTSALLCTPLDYIRVHITDELASNQSKYRRLFHQGQYSTIVREILAELNPKVGLKVMASAPKTGLKRATYGAIKRSVRIARGPRVWQSLGRAFTRGAIRSWKRRGTIIFNEGVHRAWRQYSGKVFWTMFRRVLFKKGGP